MKPRYRIVWIYDWMYINPPVIGYRIVPIEWTSAFGIKIKLDPTLAPDEFKIVYDRNQS